MDYKHVDNLYRDQRILELTECYALEKIHGTSAHISFKDGELKFFSGGCKHSDFITLFDKTYLETAMASFGRPLTVYGEAYGGKMQGMRETYGDSLKFVAFEAAFDETWLSVPDAEMVAKMLKLEFVHYVRINAKLEDIDRERDADSVQAIRNGMGTGKMREGVVLRPITELVDERGNRIMAKHKRAEFMETATPRTVDPNKREALKNAIAIAEEWVTPMRLSHVIDNLQATMNAVAGLEQKTLQAQDTRTVIELMIEDVKREAKGEIVESKEALRAIGNRTAKLFIKSLNENLKGNL